MHFCFKAMRTIFSIRYFEVVPTSKEVDFLPNTCMSIKLDGRRDGGSITCFYFYFIVDPYIRMKRTIELLVNYRQNYHRNWCKCRDIYTGQCSLTSGQMASEYRCLWLAYSSSHIGNLHPGRRAVTNKQHAGRWPTLIRLDRVRL